MSNQASHSGHSKHGLAWMALAALGVVFGDIGTSPLYAFRACFYGSHAVARVHENLVGAASLIVWSLILIVSVKYLLLILRLDNKGEGGILALAALVRSASSNLGSQAKPWMFIFGLFGAALIYADGMLTPAISVLSAVEGLSLVGPQLHDYVVPIAIGVLVGVFAIQRHGTANVGKLFGPVICLWFTTLGVMGLAWLVREPKVLLALSPHSAVMFLIHEGAHAIPLLGAVFLAVTGGEALYADLGHFGIKPIRAAWFYLVFPALVLHYLGQAALVMTSPDANNPDFHPFFQMAPEFLRLPLTILATAAAVIASQALISGAFSLTAQAIHLGCIPRIHIRYTSATEKGQVYLPLVNWFLASACILIVVVAKSSLTLEGAYGIAIALTMTVTTVLFYFASRMVWHWSNQKAMLVTGVFLTIDCAFLIANGMKIIHGGWFPLVVAGLLLFVMTTWRWGRARMGQRMAQFSLPVDSLMQDLQKGRIHRVPGTAVYMSGKPDGVPIALLHNLKHNHVLHEQVILLNVQTLDVPKATPEERFVTETVGEGLHRVVLRYGFSEDPDVPKGLAAAAASQGKNYDPGKTTFFLGRESYAVGKKTSGFDRFRLAWYAWMSRNASPPTVAFRLPPSRVVELGAQLTL